MGSNMKKFILIFTAWLFILSPFGQPEKGFAANEIDNMSLYAKMKHTSAPRHPYLFASSSDFEAIRAKIPTNKNMKQRYANFLRTANAYLNAETIVYELRDGIRLLPVSEDAYRYITTLAFAYQIERDTCYSDKAVEQLLAICAFDDWQPDNFLSCAELTAAAAIGYDWLYSVLSPEERLIVETAIMEKGLLEGKYAYDHPTGQTNMAYHWVFGDHNWNPYSNGGMILGAAALADKEPDFCYGIIKSALNGLRVYAESLGPDGGSVEGVGYWGMGMGGYLRACAALESLFNTDFGLLNVPYLRTSGRFLETFTHAGMTFNFHDAGEGEAGFPELLYLGVRAADTTLCAYRLEQLDKKGFGATAFDFIWYKGESAVSGVPFVPDSYYRNVESGTLRSTSDDMENLFLGFHGGRNDVQHNHHDSGSFVLDSQGQRFASDLGSDNLTYVPDGDPVNRYDLYRMRAEGHNTLVLNPAYSDGQNGASNSPVINFQSGVNSARAVMDLSDAYKSANAASVLREFSLRDKRRRAVVQDKIPLKSVGTVYWFMHTQAEIELLDDNTALLTRGGKQLLARLRSPDAAAAFDVMDAFPLSSSPIPNGQADNGNFKKLFIRFDSVLNLEYSVEFTPVIWGYTMPETEFTPLSDRTLERDDIYPKISRVSFGGKRIANFDENLYTYDVFTQNGEPVAPQYDALDADVEILTENNIMRIRVEKNGLYKEYFFRSFPSDIFTADFTDEPAGALDTNIWKTGLANGMNIRVGASGEGLILDGGGKANEGIAWFERKNIFDGVALGYTYVECELEIPNMNDGDTAYAQFFTGEIGRDQLVMCYFTSDGRVTDARGVDLCGYEVGRVRAAGILNNKTGNYSLKITQNGQTQTFDEIRGGAFNAIYKRFGLRNVRIAYVNNSAQTAPPVKVYSVQAFNSD